MRLQISAYGNALKSSAPAAGVAGCIILLVSVLGVGCRNTPARYSPLPLGGGTAGISRTNTIDPAWLQPDGKLFTLGPGDKVDIELLGETNTLTSTVVGPDGKVYFSLLPGIDVWGLTLAQAKARLEEEMSKYVRDRPQIGITLRTVESKRVWVLGRVQAPGVFPLATPTTLLEAMALAGGTMSLSQFQFQEAGTVGEELADLKRSFVLREGRLLPVDFERLLKQGDLSQNIYLQRDDFVYLPGGTAREVYVLGAVTQPRPIPYREGLTVAAAIASAYGTINGAYMHHVVVVRGSLAQPEMLMVDYALVIRGQVRDIELEPQDIVYVPFSPYRYLHKYLDIALQTFASSVAINAGQRAVGQEQGVGGVFIPVGSGVQIMPPATPPPIR